MKHVFVETNFIIDLVRPFSLNDAHKLARRAQLGEVTLHVPWCAVKEAKRTIERIIQEDFSFIKGVQEYAKRKFLSVGSGGTMPFDKGEIDKLARLARREQINADTTAHEDVDAACSHMHIVPPSDGVVARTLGLFPAKKLPPFDEMILGAVLYSAEQLHASGERELWFCSLNNKDFKDTGDLAQAYASAGLRYLDSFRVP